MYLGSCNGQSEHKTNELLFATDIGLITELGLKQ